MQHNPECPACRGRKQQERDEKLARLEVRVEGYKAQHESSRLKALDAEHYAIKRVSGLEVDNIDIKSRLKKVEEEQNRWTSPAAGLALFAACVAIFTLISVTFDLVPTVG